MRFQRVSTPLITTQARIKPRVLRPVVMGTRSLTEAARLQVDASHHDWLEDRSSRRIVLAPFIDDTSSRVPIMCSGRGSTTARRWRPISSCFCGT